MAANMHDGTEDYTLLNVFTPRPNQLDALERLQLSEMKAMSADAAALGWLGDVSPRLHPAESGVLW